MSDQSPVLGMPYIMPAQAQKHVTHNVALDKLDMLVQLTAETLGQITPAAPEPGERHIVGAGATGDWAGHDGALAHFTGSTWQFETARPGWTAYIRSARQFAAFNGTGWDLVEPAQLAQLGVNAEADSTNRLSVSSPAVLLNHAGAGHRVKINKATAGDTASLLFQSNWSGRAEIGLAGEDDLSIKVSADGGAWLSALRFDPASGGVSGAAVQQSATDAAPGRLMLAEHGLLRSDISGPVAQQAGVPTGAVVESGFANGGYFTKWADGTMQCHRMVAVDLGHENPQLFDYPDPMVVAFGGQATGANRLEADNAYRANAAYRIKEVGRMPVWTDTSGWMLQVIKAEGQDTIDMHLSAFGRWY